MATTVTHSSMADADMHPIIRWSVADQAARLAIVPVAGDAHKVAFQLDTGVYYTLLTVSPVVWTALNLAPVVDTIARWTVANEAARLALVPVAGDEHKVAFQTDTAVYYALTVVGPATWVALNAPVIAGGPVLGDILLVSTSSDFTGTQPLDGSELVVASNPEVASIFPAVGVNLQEFSPILGIVNAAKGAFVGIATATEFGGVNGVVAARASTPGGASDDLVQIFNSGTVLTITNSGGTGAINSMATIPTDNVNLNGVALFTQASSVKLYNSSSQFMTTLNAFNTLVGMTVEDLVLFDAMIGDKVLCQVRNDPSALDANMFWALYNVFDGTIEASIPGIGYKFDGIRFYDQDAGIFYSEDRLGDTIYKLDFDLQIATAHFATEINAVFTSYEGFCFTDSFLVVAGIVSGDPFLQKFNKSTGATIGGLIPIIRVPKRLTAARDVVVVHYLPPFNSVGQEATGLQIVDMVSEKALGYPPGVPASQTLGDWDEGIVVWSQVEETLYFLMNDSSGSAQSEISIQRLFTSPLTSTFVPRLAAPSGILTYRLVAPAYVIA
jgi:hypothetical protein